MIKNADGSFDNYSILTVVRQILLHWGYELVEDNWLWFIFLFI